jgi:hypothetical protein
MAQEPDRIRSEIEYTRAELTRDVDRLADKTSPKRVAQRRWSAVKEKVMGTPSSTSYGPSFSTTDSVKDKASSAADSVKDKASLVSDKAGEAAHSAADSVRSAPQKVAQHTQGNPIAAGVIAFGVGLLAASLIPATEIEKRAGQQLKDNAGDLADRVDLQETAQELKEDLTGTVRDAAQQVKDTAQDAARTTGDEAKSSARGAADDAKQAAHQAS